MTDSILEQIWFPGVHSDVGGGARNIDLPKIALLTMIDRTLLYTRLNISFKDLTARYCKPFEDKLMIESEWNTFWRVVSLFRKNRRVPVGVEAKIHPLADYLSEKNHTYKLSKSNSTRQRPELKGIGRAKTFLSHELAQHHLLPDPK